MFSGDMIAPSIISTVKHGEQLIKPFNNMKIDAACIGNHEFDFGIEGMIKVLGPTSKPNGSCQWVMSNLRPKG